MRGRTAIITAAYNGQRYLPETILSVQRQRLQPLEHLVVDDGSTDDSAGVARRLGTRVVEQANAGVAATRNRGRRELLTAPEYLLFLDHDDVLEPDMLAELEAHLDAHPEAGLVYSGLRIIDEGGQLTGNLGEGWPQRVAPGRGWRVRAVPPDEPRTPLLSILSLVAIMPSVSLIRASIFDAVGGFDERYRAGGAEDTSLAVEVALRSEVHHVPAHLVRYREHAGMQSSDVARVRAAQAELLTRLRRRPEPALRRAFRDEDRRIVARSARDARYALSRREVSGAARIVAGAGRLLVRMYAPRPRPG